MANKLTRVFVFKFGFLLDFCENFNLVFCPSLISKLC